MAYKVLALKYRPQKFDDVVGQNQITTTLKNSFIKDRIAQGYIFTGPRGVGKTTSARILAMALNADGGPDIEFDPKSETSMEISSGRALDVIEIDGASNRGIDEIRSLREQIKFAPMKSKYKIIIIDEVHMLTIPAFNALLRTLEEPPAHGKFIFCTTDIHKVPITIISRCQRFDFNLILEKTIVNRLAHILSEENIEYEKEALYLISRKADGSMRDALSSLDQIISFCDKNITHDKVSEVLGVIPIDIYFDYTDSIRESNGAKMLNTLNTMINYGISIPELINDINIHIRNLIYSTIDKGVDSLKVNDDTKLLYQNESKYWNKNNLLKVGDNLSSLFKYIRISESPALLLEMASMNLLHSIDMKISHKVKASNENLINQNNSKIKDLEELKPLEIKNDILEDNKLIDENEISKQIKEGDLLELEATEIEKENQEDIKLSDENEISKQIIEEAKVVDKIINKNQNFPVTLESLINDWKTIMDYLYDKRPSLGSVLNTSRPTGFDGENITIHLSGEIEFHIKLVEKYLDVLEKIISEKIGKNIKVLFRREKIESKIEIKKEIITQNLAFKKDEKTLDRILDVFDGEILR